MQEQPFDVQGPDALVRRGVWTPPAPQGKVAASKLALILLPAGLKYRAGAHRFNVLLARHLAALGVGCLRFDPLGVGESDGLWSGAPQAKLWQAVERGLFVADVALAAQALRERMGVQSIYAGGLCGGAVTAVLAAAAKNSPLQGVLSLGLPVLPTPQADDAVPPLQTEVARHMASNYLRKLRSPDAWRRVLSGHSNVRAIARTLGLAASTLAGPWPRRADANRPESAWLLEGMRELQRKQVPHLMLFGGADNRWLEFESTVLVHELQGQRHGLYHEVDVIDQASHELHFEGFKQQALERIERWLLLQAQHLMA